jgi:DMSO reductase anchor subunit
MLAITRRWVRGRGQRSQVGPMSPGARMRSNLTTQGYCLSDEERRELSLALRFSTGLCLTLVIVALALESPVIVFALAGIGVIAGFSARHPFDHVWNHLVRHMVGGPALPPNPTRRRHAFKVATVWLATVGGLLSVGATLAALLLGGLLVAACATVTAANLCIPSEALAWWEYRTARKTPTAI